MTKQPSTLGTNLVGTVIACWLIAPVAYLLGVQSSIIIGGVIGGLLLTVVMFYARSRRSNDI